MGITRKLGRRFLGVSVATAAILAVAVPLTSQVASAAGNISLAQCANGGVTATPVSCVQTAAANTTTYQNGNLNGQQAHFLEGSFIPYQFAVNNLSAGPHTLDFGWRLTDSGHHALDYIGSYDTTETVGPSPNPLFAGNNNICGGGAIQPAAWCTPPLPEASVAVPAPDFGDVNSICGTSGSVPTSLQLGDIKFYGPSAGITNVTFAYDGGSSSGQITFSKNGGSGGGSDCFTDATLSFTLTSALSSSDNIIIGVGGHIASQADWGQGNSASFINGSPYHMFINNIDGNPTGQDRSLKTDAIILTPTVNTVVEDTSNLAITNPVPLGTVVHDTATITNGQSPTGTVTYAFYNNDQCTGTPVSTQQEGFTNGVPDPSPPSAPLAAGGYGYLVSYSGDHANNPATGTCEPVDVSEGTSTVATTLKNANGDTTIADNTSVPLGTSVYDTSVVTPSPSAFTPGGTVTYTFYSDTTCTHSLGTEGSGLSLGSNSNTVGPLASGSYGFEATWTGDSNYTGNTSPCEPFTVGKGTSTVATTLKNAAGNTTIADNAHVALGTSVYDTSTVTPSSNTFTPGGTVSYTFYSDTNCTTAIGTEGTGLTLGTQSTTVGPLAAGTYGFKATWTGDSNYTGNTSPCEPFTVNQGTSTVATTLKNADGNATIANNSTVPLNTSVYDTSVVTPSSTGFTLGGTVSYTFFSDTSCTTAIGTKGTGLAVGSNSSTVGPLAAGTYGFEAIWTGDSNYTGNTSPCEPFTVGQGSSRVATTLHNADGGGVITDNSTVPLGTSVYDTNVVTPSSTGFTLGGTVSYTFFSDTSCTSAIGTEGTGLSLGTQSSTVGPLGAGNYGFEATWTGDSNFTGSTSPCEPFTVGQGTSTVATTLKNADGNTTIADNSALPLGTQVYDTSAVTPDTTGFTLDGTVSYTFFSDTSCTTAIGTEGTGLSLGTHSDTVGPLAAGSYGFEATWTGDSNFTGNTSPCEPFTVNKSTSTVATTLKNADGDTTIDDGSAVGLGTSVYDTSVVTPDTTGFDLGGTVSYTFFSDLTCTTSVGTEGTDLALGTQSSTVGPLAAGDYGFEATWTGDSNFTGNTSPCEPFTVTMGSSTVATTLKNATGDTTIADGSQVPLDTSVYDTSVVTPNTTGFDLGGTVTYTFFSDLTCTTSVGTEGTDMALGTNSNTVGPLAAGDYGFQATWTGDSNFTGNTSPCEPFTVTTPNFTILKTDVPGNGQPVTAGSTIPYTIAIKNVGSGPGSGTVTDVVPSSLTVQGTPKCAVTGSDTCTVTNTTGSTWTFAVDLAVNDTATVTFSAVLAATATGTVANTGTITTGPCTTTSGCSSTVSNPIPPVTAPAVVTPTTTTTAPPATKPAVIAFTGADIAAMAAGGLVLLGLGGFLVLLSRRRRRSTGEIA